MLLRVDGSGVVLYGQVLCEGDTVYFVMYSRKA